MQNKSLVLFLIILISAMLGSLIASPIVFRILGCRSLYIVEANGKQTQIFQLSRIQASRRSPNADIMIYHMISNVEFRPGGDLAYSKVK